ncbi:MAG: hypothetical protein KBG28_01010 [Kofleriaceae bacterium]|jgi:hypothetical protein|nr:hypothetical protein [Kofleriaceae bacterium]MBP6840981.1 hypothetical protein [Kofleriaceae bacterium]MBP9202530.1 hypothetical protein [Kofleriaceae bacterium]
MARPGWNPTRRNRHQGTAARGHGQDNRLTIPDSWLDTRMYWERLRLAVVVRRDLDGQPLTVLVEPPAPGFVHACTVDDVVAVWALIPADERRGLELVALRQPTRKERTLAASWGRLGYASELAPGGGPAIFLHAVRARGVVLRWPRSMTPADTQEFERLRSDGFAATESRRWIELVGGVDVVRATLLYRTLLHEVGHYVDWCTSVLAHVGTAEEDERWRAYDGKPGHDKEAFAHAYATRLAAALRAGGHLPVPRRRDEAGMIADGLDPAWFA